MRIAVTGATGFVGRHVVQYLQQDERHEVIACGRRAQALRSFDCESRVFDLTDLPSDCFHAMGSPDAVIHLAWGDLTDYASSTHTDVFLPSHYRFIREIVKAGLKRLIGIGTCYEYGLRDGRMTESDATEPTIAYAVAKDCLRRLVSCLSRSNDFEFRWLRLFFVHGEGQSGRSLVPQIDEAHQRGDLRFAMSSGEQIRDYLPVSQAAEFIGKVSLQSEVNGVINICSGNPISVRRFVEEHLESRGSRMQLTLGRYPLPTYEPLSYWGDVRRLNAALNAFKTTEGRADHGCGSSGFAKIA